MCFGLRSLRGFFTVEAGEWGDNAFFHQVCKKHVEGNQLSGACGASAPFVREISQIVVDTASGHVAVLW